MPTKPWKAVRSASVWNALLTSKLGYEDSRSQFQAGKERATFEQGHGKAAEELSAANEEVNLLSAEDEYEDES
jgi:hypothetical protein